MVLPKTVKFARRTLPGLSREYNGFALLIPMLPPLVIMFPLTVIVVNTPLPGVTLPIARACRPPTVSVVNAAVPGVTLPIA